MPNLIIAAPRDVRDLKKLIDLSVTLNQPMAIRYPKEGLDLGPGIAAQQPFRVGEWELISDGADVMFFAVGPMVQIAMQASIELMGKNIHAGVVDARFIKPMDEEMLLKKCAGVRLVVTLEENTTIGGLGEGIAHILLEHAVNRPMLMLGAPDDFVAHARVSQQRKACGLSAEDICAKVIDTMNHIGGGQK